MLKLGIIVGFNFSFIGLGICFKWNLISEVYTVSVITFFKSDSKTGLFSTIPCQIVSVLVSALLIDQTLLRCHFLGLCHLWPCLRYPVFFIRVTGCLNIMFWCLVQCSMGAMFVKFMCTVQ